MCKTRIIIMASLLLSGAMSFAGSMGSVCDGQEVTIPCELNGWDFGVQGLYLKPTYGTPLHFASYTDANGVQTYRGVRPAQSMGIRFEGSYHFNTGNDLDLNWLYYKKATTAQMLVGTAAAPVSVGTEIKPRLDAVNLEFGQRVNFSEKSIVRFHEGVQFSRISTNYFANIISRAHSATDAIYLKYNGFGPRIGADFSYNLSSSFGIYANAASALLVGDQSFNTNTAQVFDLPGATNGSKTALVPEVEGKVGLRYAYQAPQGIFNVDLGYLFVNYFQAQNFFTPSKIGGSMDFGVHGPYVGVKYLGFAQ